MQIIELKNASDAYTDEEVETVHAIVYANEAIGKINSRGYSLPLIKTNDIEYPNAILPDGWQARLLVNHISYGVKMKETDIEEAMIYLQQFDDALRDFLTKAPGILNPEYVGDKDSDGNNIEAGVGGVYVNDTSEAIDIGWFGTTRGEQ